MSREALLESYDGSVRLRPIWDEIASKYSAVAVPSAVDDAPVGLKYTGDSVSTPFGALFHKVVWLYHCDSIDILTYVAELLHHVDAAACSLCQCTWIHWTKRSPTWPNHRWAAIS